MSTQNDKKSSKAQNEADEHFFIVSLNKKIRNANKKLREIKDLELVENLNEAQEEKIANKSSLLAQIQDVERVKAQFQQAEKEYNQENKKQNKKQKQAKTAEQTEQPVQLEVKQQVVEVQNEVDTTAVTQSAIKLVVNFYHFANFVRAYERQELVSLLNLNLGITNSSDIVGEYLASTTAINEAVNFGEKLEESYAYLNNVKPDFASFLEKFAESSLINMMTQGELDAMNNQQVNQQQEEQQVEEEEEEPQVTHLVPQNTVDPSHLVESFQMQKNIQQQLDEFMLESKNKQREEERALNQINEENETQQEVVEKVQDPNDGFIEVKIKKKEVPEKQHDNRKYYNKGGYKGNNRGDRQYKENWKQKDGEKPYGKRNYQGNRDGYKNRDGQQSRDGQSRGGYRKNYDNRNKDNNHEPRQEREQNVQN